MTMIEFFKKEIARDKIMIERYREWLCRERRKSERQHLRYNISIYRDGIKDDQVRLLILKAGTNHDG